MRPKYKIVHTDANDSTQVDLTSVYEFDTAAGIQASMDTFQFRIIVNASPVREIEVDDVVDIYLDDTDGTPTTLVINVMVSDLKFDIIADGMVLTVKGVNRIERLLMSPRYGLYATNFSYTGKRDSVTRTGWGAVITHLIDKANEYKVDTDVVVITYDITSIPDLGNLSVRYDSEWRGIYEHLERLATPEWTPNGQEYFIELDTNNKIWFRSKDTPDYQVSVSTIDLDGANVINATVNYGVFDIINFLRLNCGKDTAGNSVVINRQNIKEIRTKDKIFEGRGYSQPVFDTRGFR